VRGVDAAAEEVDVRVQAALALPELVAAGEHHVGLAHEQALALEQLGGANLNCESSSMQSYTTPRSPKAPSMTGAGMGV
jgi:hypothetical protein